MHTGLELMHIDEMAPGDYPVPTEVIRDWICFNDDGICSEWNSNKAFRQISLMYKDHCHTFTHLLIEKQGL